MKRNLLKIIFLMGISIFLIPEVFAKDIYYTNINDVSMAKNEYDFIGDFYWEGYQKYITETEYNNLQQLDLFGRKIEKKSVSTIQTRGSSVTEKLRTLTIAKACNSNCSISLVARWNGTPFVKSYDVIGARLNNVSLMSTPIVQVTGTNYSKTYTNHKQFNNGYGTSILLPNNNNLIVSSSFIVSKGGTVFGSYQHAMSNTSEYVSHQYNIGVGGFGNVFNFFGSAASIYDGANGVDISL